MTLTPKNASIPSSFRVGKGVQVHHPRFDLAPRAPSSPRAKRPNARFGRAAVGKTRPQPLLASPVVRPRNGAAGAKGRDFCGIMGVGCDDNQLVVVHDGTIDVVHLTQDRSTSFESQFTLENFPLISLALNSHSNPYVELDTEPTRCTHALRKQCKPKSTVVSTAVGKRQTQGTVVGKAFSSGFHAWSLKVNDVSLVAVGIVSQVGLGHLECSDGRYPPYLCCLKQGIKATHRLYWTDGIGQEFSKPTNQPIESLIRGNGEDELTVYLDFTSGQVGFFFNHEPLGIISAGPSTFTMVGEHTLAVHLKSGAEVEALFHPRGDLHPLQGTSRARVEPLAGNPYIRWDHVDGIEQEVGFVLPLGVTFLPDDGYMRCIVSDGGRIREVDLDTGTVSTVSLSIEGLPETDVPLQNLFLCGMCELGGTLYATELWNQAVLAISPNAGKVWTAKAVMKRCFAGANVAGARNQVSEAWSTNIANNVWGENALKACMRANPRHEDGAKGGWQLFGLGPWGVAAIGTWLFVTDSRRHCIYGWDTESSGSEVVVVAGTPGSPGDKEGWGSMSRFRHPTGVVADEASLCLYVADTGNNRIVKVLLRYYSNRYEGCVLPVDLVLEGPLGDPDRPLQLHLPIALAIVVSQTNKMLVIAEAKSRNIYQASLLASHHDLKEGTTFSAPLERIMAILKSLRNGVSNDSQFVVDEALELLSRSKNIYAAQMVENGDDEMDEEVAGWLRAGFFEDEKPTWFESSLANEADLLQTPVSEHRTPIAIRSRKTSAGPRFEPVRTARMRNAISLAPEISRIPVVGIDELDFDIWCLHREAADAGGPLFQMMLNLFSQYQFRERYNIDRNRLLAFCNVIQTGYKDNPYHNATHAADVLQTVHALLQKTELASRFSDLEVLALLVSAAIHDYDHPGVNNQFLINTKDPLALRYNDMAVLENYHVSQVFELFHHHPELDWTQSLSPADRAIFREIVISLVLGTDMKQHFSLLVQLKTRFAQGEPSSSPTTPSQPRSWRRLSQGGSEKRDWDDEDKRVLMRSLLHAADISNPTKTKDVYLAWTNRVMTEFSEQGKLEKEHDLPYSPFCEPEPDVPKCQRGFIDFVVRPQFEALAKAFPQIGDMLVNLEVNYSHWSHRNSAREKLLSSDGKH